MKEKCRHYKTFSFITCNRTTFNDSWKRSLKWHRCEKIGNFEPMGRYLVYVIISTCTYHPVLDSFWHFIFKIFTLTVRVHTVGFFTPFVFLDFLVFSVRGKLQSNQVNSYKQTAQWECGKEPTYIPHTVSCICFSQ